MILIAVSCGQSPKKSSQKKLNEIQREFVDIMLDSSSSWQLAMDVIHPFMDTICVAAVDEINLKNRMFGQQWGYVAIDLISDKYDYLKNAGKEASLDDLSAVVGKLTNSIATWFFSSDEQLPHLWRDQYYVSNKSAEEQTNGFFHIMVTLPTQAHPKPTLQIFYPDNAIGCPAIFFGEHLDDNVFDNGTNLDDLVELSNWHRKHELDDIIPMWASADEDVVIKMLSHPVMYLLFQSEDAADGTQGELEVALVILEPMQTLWKEHIK